MQPPDALDDVSSELLFTLFEVFPEVCETGQLD
jgi:hypothetical protein